MTTLESLRASGLRVELDISSGGVVVTPASGLTPEQRAGLKDPVTRWCIVQDLSRPLFAHLTMATRWKAWRAARAADPTVPEPDILADLDRGLVPALDSRALPGGV